MAELTPVQPRLTGARLGWSQFRAIAWLRWRILVNSLRRGGGVGELIGRILLLPFVVLIVLGPAVLAGFLAWYVAQSGSLGTLPLLFWGVFVLTQVFNLNLGQPGTTFDPSELIRFPLRLGDFIFVRLCFGLLTPGNLVVALASFAIFVGVTVARAGLWPWALLATSAFALTNVLFTRMIFAWVDRWLSTRRAREVFTTLIFVFSIGIQYLNATYNPGFHHNRSGAVNPENLHRAQAFLASVHPFLAVLPPELAAAAVRQAFVGHIGLSLAATALTLLYGVAFLLVYSLRMRVEYRGENLSDAANAVRPAPRASRETTAHAAQPFTPPIPLRPGLLPPTLVPLLGKELLLLRRNVGLLYGVAAPTAMVFIFAGRLSFSGASHWALLLAVGYGLLGIAPMSYNTFGPEGTGAQFYFFAPVPLREVFLAKNIMQFLLAGVEITTILVIITFLSGPPRLLDVLFVVFWAAATLLLNTSIGNLRSVSAPKKVSNTRSFGRNQSQVSAWIAIGIFSACAALGTALQFLATLVHLPWIAPLTIALFAAGALFAYRQGLRSIETYAMDRRERLFEELGKKT